MYNMKPNATIHQVNVFKRQPQFKNLCRCYLSMSAVIFSFICRYFIVLVLYMQINVIAGLQPKKYKKVFIPNILDFS